MNASSDIDTSLKSRLAHELKSYAVISLYLFVCFSVLLIYEASQSASANLSLLTLGTAVIKSLVIGKFILIGEALKPGTRVVARTLLHRIAWRSLGLLSVLVLLKLLEEMVIGLAHGMELSAIIGELRNTTWLEMLAPVLLMLLILIPLMMAIELNSALGAGGLKGLLLR